MHARNLTWLPRHLQYKNISIGGEAVVLGGQISLQTGDFDNDGYPELVFGFIDGNTGKFMLYEWDLKLQYPTTWNGLAKLSRTNLQPCGCFDKEAIMRNLFDTLVPVDIPGSPSFPVVVGGTRVDAEGFSFSLGAGDVGIFGYDFVRRPPLASNA